MPRLAALLCLLSTPAFAQDEPPSEPSVPVPAPVPVPVPAPPPPPTPGVTLAATSNFTLSVDGFLRLKGAIVQNDPEVAFVGRNDGFLLQNARIGLTGTFRDRILVRLSAEGAADEREGRNDVEGTLRFVLKDAYADLRLVDAAHVRAGRFEAIWDIDEYVGETDRAFIDRGVASRGVLPTQGFETPGLRPGRSLGVALRSDTAADLGGAKLGYELAVQNGNGELDAENDNDRVAISAAALVHSSSVLLIASGRYNPRTEGELPFQQTERDLEGAAGVSVGLGPVRFGAQAYVRHTSFPTTGGPAENSYGGHAQLVATFALGSSLTLSPGYRWGFYEPSDLVVADQVQEHTAGLTLASTTWPVRLQLFATHAVEQPGRELDNSRIEALFEVRL